MSAATLWSISRMKECVLELSHVCVLVRHSYKTNKFQKVVGVIDSAVLATDLQLASLYRHHCCKLEIESSAAQQIVL